MTRIRSGWPGWMARHDESMVIDECVACGRDRRLFRDRLCRPCYLRMPRMLDVSSPPPTSCSCATPRPEPVRLFGTVLVADAIQCGRCARPIFET